MEIDDENTSAQSLLQTLNSYLQNEAVKYESFEPEDEVTVLHSAETSEYPRFTFPVPEDPRYMLVFESPNEIRVFKFYRHNNKPSFYCVGCSNTRVNKRKYLLRGCDWPEGSPYPISFNVPKPEDHTCEILNLDEARTKVFSLMSRKSHGKSANAGDGTNLSEGSQEPISRVILKRKKILKIPSISSQIRKTPDFSGIIEDFQISPTNPHPENVQSTSRIINNSRIIQITLIKEESDPNLVRRFIQFNDGLICQFCREMGNPVLGRIDSDGSISISGDHLPNCQPFSFSESSLSLQKTSTKIEPKKKTSDYELHGNILKVGDREYIDTDGDQESYYCKLCLKLKKTVVEAKLKTIVVEDEHCKECEESRTQKSEPCS